MKEGAENAALGDQVGKDLGAKNVDIAADVAKLSALPMPQLLDVLERMKAQKKPSTISRTTCRPTSAAGWAWLSSPCKAGSKTSSGEPEAPKLSEEDRAAVMMRAPAKIRPITPGPAKAGDKPEDPVEVEAVIAGSKDGVEMQVKITAHSSNGAKLGGETEGTVYIGPGGKLSRAGARHHRLPGRAHRQGQRGRGDGDRERQRHHRHGQGWLAHRQERPQRADQGRARGLAEARVKAFQGVTAKVNGTYGTAGNFGGTIGLEFKIPRS